MINVLISADSRYQVDKNFLRQVAITTLEQNRVKGKIEVSISVVGDRAMTGLNKKYRGKGETTDVLAFPQQETIPTRFLSEPKKAAGFVKPPDKVLRLGDVVISYPHAMGEAAKFSVPIEEELAILVEHGIDHLLGIHHE